MQSELSKRTLRPALTEQRSSPRRVLRALARTAVGGVLLGLLIARTGVGELQRAFSTARPAFVVAAFALIAFGVAVSAVRWSGFLDALGCSRPYAYLVRLYAVGLFFNSFLPTGIGGDVFKAMRVRRTGDPMGPGFASVVLDRAAGIVGLAVLGLAAALARVALGDRSRVVLFGLALSALVAVGTGVLAGASRFRQRISRLVTGRLGRMIDSLETAIRSPKAAGRGLVWGLFYQWSVIAFHGALMRSLGLRVPLTALVCVVVVVTFASLVPITINGLGVREGAYVWCLHTYGVDTHAALAFALLVLGLLLAAGAAGGVVYLLGGADPPVAD
jgi:uncharacterized protein (TIRG00374 family)